MRIIDAVDETTYDLLSFNTHRNVPNVIHIVIDLFDFNLLRVRLDVEKELTTKDSGKLVPRKSFI